MISRTTGAVFVVAIAFIAYVFCGTNLHVAEQLAVDDLPPHLSHWRARGALVTVNGFQHFVTAHGVDVRVLAACAANSAQQCSAPPLDEVIILMHGFPSSSYEFHRVMPRLREERPSLPIIAFDHLGFGFSEKPQEDGNYYSVFDLAENAVALWQSLGIKRAHVIAHDVGNTILNEVLARYHRSVQVVEMHAGEKGEKGRCTRGSLPCDFFLSVTFSNGGMVYEHSRPRLFQSLLSSRVLPGSWLQRTLWTLDPNGSAIRAQARSVWGSSRATMEGDIDDMLSMLRVANGHLISNRILWYLRERQSYERRWHDALRSGALDEIPCRIVWGAEDAVAPLSVAKALIEITQGRCLFSELKGTGHFLQLENPEAWVAAVVSGLP